MCWKLLKYVLWTSKQWLVEPSYSKHSNSPTPEQHDSNKHLMNISQQLSTPRVDALTWVSISIIHKSISSHKIGINEWIFGMSRPGGLKWCDLLGINLILARRPTVQHNTFSSRMTRYTKQVDAMATDNILITASHVFATYWPNSVHDETALYSTNISFPLLIPSWLSQQQTLVNRNPFKTKHHELSPFIKNIII